MEEATKNLTLIFWHFTRDTFIQATRLVFMFLSVWIRAFVRPVLGGFFAIGVFLILSSGIIMEPIIASFADAAGKVDYSKQNTIIFFLGISFVAGFSDELALSLLGKAADALGSRESRRDV